MNYFQIIQQLFYKPNALKPHIIVKNLQEIDFKKLQSLGVKYIVFDRDNTLTEHMSEDYNPERKEKQVVQACQEMFGYDNIALLSNSILNKRGKQLNLPLIYTSTKKPLNYFYIKEHFLGLKTAEEICIVGDRLLTDIVLANINGCVGILVTPIDTSKEPLGISLMRMLENNYMALQSSKTQPHCTYGNMN